MDRLSLHTILVSIVPNVYYQPPESLKLTYPCIVYKRDKIEPKFANNGKYADSTRYQITSIDRNPDAEWPRRIFDLPKCSHVRQYVADSLNHDVFELYY